VAVLAVWLSFTATRTLRTHDGDGNPLALTQQLPRPAVPRMDGVWYLRMVADRAVPGSSFAVGDTVRGTMVIGPTLPSISLVGPPGHPWQQGIVHAFPRHSAPDPDGWTGVMAAMRGPASFSAMTPLAHGCSWDFELREHGAFGTFAFVGHGGADRGTFTAVRKEIPRLQAVAAGRAWVMHRQTAQMDGGAAWSETGWLRVRIRDSRTGLPLDGSAGPGGVPWVRSSRRGFGPLTRFPAGVPAVSLFTFRCGQRELAVDPMGEGVPTAPVRVRQWLPALVTLDVDPTAIAVLPSLGNPAGERCAG
jgi:hypothetical protein